MDSRFCPLCHSTKLGVLFREEASAREYSSCDECGLVHLRPEQRLTGNDEKMRYLHHENSVEDSGYRAFLEPVVVEVSTRLAGGGLGLDFGAGPGPALAAMLTERGHRVALYDPFFHPSSEVLVSGHYDFVVCTEAAEHFFDPAREFRLMRSLLKPGGFLVVMTRFVPDREFEQWHYRRDPTHVCFFREDTFQWMGREFGFARVSTKSPSIAVMEV